MICDMIVILKDTDTTNMPELIKIVEEKGGSIFSIKDINEKCKYILIGNNSIKQIANSKIPKKAIIFINIKFLQFIII